MPPGSMQWDEPSFHCGPWYAKDRWQEWGLPMLGPGGGTPITGSLRHILAALLVCLLLWKSDKRAKSHNTLAPALRLAGLERVHCSCGQRSLTPTRTASCPGPEATERPNLPTSAVRLCLWLPQVKGQQAKGCNKPALVVRGNTLLP